MRKVVAGRSATKSGAVENDESLQRQLIVNTVGMFYTLRVLPARKQLLCELESLQRSAWAALRAVEVRRLRAIAVLSHEYIVREELIEQFLFERELLLEPQFVVLEEFTRGDIAVQETSHRRFLEEFIAEACTMWIRSNWKVGDPEEAALQGSSELTTMAPERSSHSSHRPKQDMASSVLSQRTSPVAAAEPAVLDAFFVPSAPPPDRRGWRPTSAPKKTAASMSQHQRRTSPHAQPIAKPISPKQSPVRMRPSTASIYRHQDKLFITPSATTNGKRWSSPRDASWKDGPSPPATAPQRRPQSARSHVVINHFVPKPRGEGHREQPYFTSHYCSPSPPSTSRPLSASSARGSSRPNHGAPLLMLTGKHASIAQTKEMLKHMSLEEVERLVPMIRMPRLDLSYNRSPRALAAREARRLFTADEMSPDGLHDADRGASCPFHGRNNGDVQQNPPMAFLSFSRPYPNSALVALPLENLAATLRAMQLHHLSNVPPHAINFLKDELGMQPNMAVDANGAAPQQGCPWCHASHPQPPDGMDQQSAPRRRILSSSAAVSPSPVATSPLQAQGRPPRPLSATPTASQGRQSGVPRNDQVEGTSGSNDSPALRDNAVAADPSPFAVRQHRTNSLREQLLLEFPFLKAIDRPETLFNLRLEFLDPLRDADFSRWAYEWKECVGGNRNGRQTMLSQQQRIQIEARMLDRCIALAREYQRQTLVVEFPFLPDAVHGVDIEHLHLQNDDAFRRVANAVLAAQQASRVPSNSTSHYALAGSTLAVAMERLDAYLDEKSRAYQRRTLQQVCPYVFVEPPQGIDAWPRDEEALHPQWSFFRMCFALYVCPPHTIGLWSDGPFLELLGCLQKAQAASAVGGGPATYNRGNDATAGAANIDDLEQRMFKLVLQRARSCRRNIFRDAGLQGRFHSWSVDELEPYLHIALSSAIPLHVDAFAILRKHAMSTTGGITALAASSCVTRMQHLLLVDWCPFLSRKRRGSTMDAATATKAEWLHQATRDVLLNASDGFGTDVSEAEYLAALPHVNFLDDATFMAACNTWMDYYREGGQLEDASAMMRGLEQKMCGRAATLARFWLEHEALMLATQREVLANAEQRWHAATDKRLSVALCGKRCVVLLMEEPHYRSLVVAQYRLQRHVLMADQYQEVSRCMLDEALRAKEQQFFIAVALVKRVEFTRNIVMPTMERLARAFQGQHHKLQLNATDRLQLEDEEDADRRDIEWEDKVFWRAAIEQERADCRVAHLMERRRHAFVEPLMAAEMSQRRTIVDTQEDAWSHFTQDASRTLTRIQSARIAVQQFIVREETTRLDCETHLLKIFTALHQDIDNALAREAAKHRRRASFQFHHAQAALRRLDGTQADAQTDPQTDAIARVKDIGVVPSRASFRGRPSRAQSIGTQRDNVADQETMHRGATIQEEDEAHAALQRLCHVSARLVDCVTKVSDDEQLDRVRVAKAESLQRDEIRSRMLDNAKLAAQLQRDAQLIASSVPFHSIFGFQDVDDWLETTDTDIVGPTSTPAVPPPPLGTADAMRRYYAATTAPGRDGGTRTILRATTSPSPSHSKRVRIADGA